MLFLVALINLLYYALLVLILARVILSFTNISPYHPVRRTVYDLTEPLLEPVRRFLPPAGGLDFSPMIVLLAAYVVRGLLIRIVIGA